MGRVAGWLMLLGAMGCNPTYAPPIRGLHAGMPGRVDRGQLEVGGTVGGWYLPTTGGPHVAYGVTDRLVVEGGANLNLVDGLWATTWAGIRLLRARSLGREVHLVGDLELGTGVGLGGRASDTLPWTSRYAWGLYQGLAVGLRSRWFGAFLRGRLDESESNATAATIWPSVMLGLEARAGRHLVFGLGGGRMAYWNEKDGLIAFWFYQAQVSLLFDLVP